MARRDPHGCPVVGTEGPLLVSILHALWQDRTAAGLRGMPGKTHLDLLNKGRATRSCDQVFFPASHLHQRADDSRLKALDKCMQKVAVAQSGAA